MYTFQQLLSQNLPIYVKVQTLDKNQSSWIKQSSIFLLTITLCLSGITLLIHFTHQLKLHHLKPLTHNFDERFVWFLLPLFLVSLVSLGFWLQEEKPKILEDSNLTDDEDLTYLLPQANSLHIAHQAWDLSQANSIIIDFPHRLIVHFKNPDRTFILHDDQSGFPKKETNPLKLKALSYNNALQVYATGAELPNRYFYKANWWWNVGAGIFFVLSTMLPFLFQALGFKLYWVSFLAIPISYLVFKVGQKEFRHHRIFNYSRFLAAQHHKIDTQLYRTPRL